MNKIQNNNNITPTPLHLERGKCGFAIAQLFNYPLSTNQQELQELQDSIGDKQLLLKPIVEHFLSNTIAYLQEYYINTFDVNATCYLDIGYVIFGEDTKRGQFLLSMQEEQRNAANNCGSEFADHLPNVLTLLPKLKDETFKEELVVSILIPALKMMLKNFKTEGNIYKQLIELLLTLLEEDFADSVFEPIGIQVSKTSCSDKFGCKTKNKF